jgi:hypothetical protein
MVGSQAAGVQSADPITRNRSSITTGAKFLPQQRSLARFLHERSSALTLFAVGERCRKFRETSFRRETHGKGRNKDSGSVQED